MSNGYSAEMKLREIAQKLHEEAYELERAADVLKTLRDANSHEEEIKAAKAFAKSYMK